MTKHGIPTVPNRSEKATAADSVQTPTDVARWVVNHFKPAGTKLEPACGDGSFLAALGRSADWCEIKQGRDFLKYDGHVDWIITNPPYSIYDVFLKKCFEVADNIVFLCPIAKAFKSQKTDRMLTEYGGIKELVLMGGGQSLGFAFGFPCGCIHFQRGYAGPITLTRARDWRIK